MMQAFRQTLSNNHGGKNAAETRWFRRSARSQRLTKEVHCQMAPYLAVNDEFVMVPKLNSLVSFSAESQRDFS